MNPIDWMYHRKGCTTCARAQAFLAKKKLIVSETVDARKVVLQPGDALKLVGGVDEIHVCRGKKIVRLDLKKVQFTEASAALLRGPSGKLRAPTLKCGRVLIVGFNEACYDALLK